MSSPMTDPTAGPINRAAKFHPTTNDDELPAIEVAGVLVFAYVGADGRLRVTVDTESADALPQWRYGVRMQINVNSGPVFEGTDNYGEYDREIIRHNTDSTPAVIVQTGEPIHVFGEVNVITGPHGAAEKLAELDADDENSERVTIEMGGFSDAPDEDNESEQECAHETQRVGDDSHFYCLDCSAHLGR